MFLIVFVFFVFWSPKSNPNNKLITIYRLATYALLDAFPKADALSFQLVSTNKAKSRAKLEMVWDSFEDIFLRLKGARKSWKFLHFQV